MKSREASVLFWKFSLARQISTPTWKVVSRLYANPSDKKWFFFSADDKDKGNVTVLLVVLGRPGRIFCSTADSEGIVLSSNFSVTATRNGPNHRGCDSSLAFLWSSNFKRALWQALKLSSSQAWDAQSLSLLGLMKRKACGWISTTSASTPKANEDHNWQYIQSFSGFCRKCRDMCSDIFPI